MKAEVKVTKEKILPPEVMALEKRRMELAVVDGEHLIAVAHINALTEKVKEIVLRSQGLVSVEDQETANRAGVIVYDIGPVRKFVKTVCDPVCDRLDKRHKAATGLRRFFDQPMAPLEDNLKGMIGRFVATREAARKKQEALLQVDADKQHQREVRSTAVTATIIHGRPVAKDIIAEMGDAPPVILEKTEVEGVDVDMEWYAQVEDIKLLVLEGVVTGKVPWAVLTVDLQFLNRQVASLGSEMQWPGVRVYQEPNVARSRSR